MIVILVLKLNLSLLVHHVDAATLVVTFCGLEVLAQALMEGYRDGGPDVCRSPLSTHQFWEKLCTLRSSEYSKGVLS